MKVKLNISDDEIYIDCYKHFNYKYKKFVRKKNKYILDCINTLDTETSHNHDKDNPCAWIYQWAMCICDTCLIGRTPIELVNELYRIKSMYKLDNEHRAIIYVHNLSYDITFLWQFLEQKFDEKIEMFCLNSHKILYAYIGGFEFRCSYLLSNMSLEKWCEKLNTKCKKLVGAIDYNTIRYQNTSLTNIDWQYQINDIYSLKECIETEMTNSGYNITNIPLTSTSFVRNDMRKTCRNSDYYNFFQKTQLNLHTYKLVRRAIQGGDTHTNRYITGQTVKGNIQYFDFKSLYPSVQMLDYFPSSPFSCYTNKVVDYKEVEPLLHNNCCIFYAMFSNPCIKKGITVPYIKVSKVLNSDYICYTDRGTKGTDNGRIINCKGDIIMALTEIDLDIIIQQYDFDDINIFNIWYADRGDIRTEYKVNILEYFRIKETMSDGYFYAKSKEKLNAIYGMTATDIAKHEIIFDTESGIFYKEMLSDEDIDEKIIKYYKSRNNFNIYQYGLYTTAHARRRLHNMISDIIGYDNHLYNDTDSCFFIDNDGSIVKKINIYNDNIIKENIERGYGVKNKKGTMSYFGTFENENKSITEFKTLHAKCYGYINDKGKLNITIAGIPKQNKHKTMTREEEIQSLDNMKSGFVFKECGGTYSKYYYSDISYFMNDNQKNIYASGCLILDNEKKINALNEEVEIYEY